MWRSRASPRPRHFPHYRAQGVETPWWRNSERLLKLDEGLLTDVLAEVRDRGALTTREMEDRGKTEPMDWSGWKSTSSRSALAAEVLWTRCDLVVSGRKGRSERVVCPVLAGDALIGRVEAVRESIRDGGPHRAVRTRLTVLGRWGEVPESALLRLAGQNGATANPSPSTAPSAPQA